MELLFLFFFFVLGLLIGSFINVVTLRFGFSETSRKRSQCQACQTTLRWYELVPLVSFLALRGRCRTCGSRLSYQYPLVEFGTGMVFAWSYATSSPLVGVLPSVSFIILLFFWSTFIALLIYDLRQTLVPTVFAAPLVFFAFLIRGGESLALLSPFALYDAVVGAALLGGALLSIVLITRGKGMGMGDVYVAAALGVFFGIARGIEVITLAFWIGAVVGMLLLGLKKGFKMKSEVPFVPFLFTAALIGAYTHFSPFLFVGNLVTLP